MLRRILFAGILAGIAAGAIVSVVQTLSTTPLILEAEKYESGALPAAPAAQRSQMEPAPSAAGGRGEGGDEAAWEPAEGLERTFYTVLANALTGVGCGFLLVAAFALSRRPVDWRRGALWGLGGFAVFSLAPALGLPPELPGMGAGVADLAAGQLWWSATVAATGIGLALIVFPARAALKGLGAVLLVAPHVIGAPHPEQFAGTVPAELAAEFVMASLLTSALFWTALGGIAGYLYPSKT